MPKQINGALTGRSGVVSAQSARGWARVSSSVPGSDATKSVFETTAAAAVKVGT